MWVKQGIDVPYIRMVADASPRYCCDVRLLISGFWWNLQTFWQVVSGNYAGEKKRCLLTFKSCFHCWLASLGKSRNVLCFFPDPLPESGGWKGDENGTKSGRGSLSHFWRSLVFYVIEISRRVRRGGNKKNRPVNPKSAPSQKVKSLNTVCF